MNLCARRLQERMIDSLKSSMRFRVEVSRGYTNPRKISIEEVERYMNASCKGG